MKKGKMSYVVWFIPKIGEGKMGLKNFPLKQPMNGYESFWVLNQLYVFV